MRIIETQYRHTQFSRCYCNNKTTMLLYGVINYRHSFLGFHNQVVVFHRQRDNAPVEVRFVRVSKTIVGRTIVQQRWQRRGSTVRRSVAAHRRRRSIIWHQNGILRFAGLQLSAKHKKHNDVTSVNYHYYHIIVSNVCGIRPRRRTRADILSFRVFV